MALLRKRHEIPTLDSKTGQLRFEPESKYLEQKNGVWRHSLIFGRSTATRDFGTTGMSRPSGLIVVFWRTPCQTLRRYCTWTGLGGAWLPLFPFRLFFRPWHGYGFEFRDG